MCAGLLSCTHVDDCPLHEEEGRAGVDAVKPVPQGRGGGNHGPPIGDAGRIHQRVDAAEFFDRRVCNDVARAILGKIRRHEMSARPQRLDLGGDGFSTGAGLRPQRTIAFACCRAASNAIARPTPCVEPVTISTMPANDGSIATQLNFHLGKNRKNRFERSSAEWLIDSIRPAVDQLAWRLTAASKEHCPAQSMAMRVPVAPFSSRLRWKLASWSSGRLPTCAAKAASAPGSPASSFAKASR